MGRQSFNRLLVRLALIVAISLGLTAYLLALKPRAEGAWASGGHSANSREISQSPASRPAGNPAGEAPAWLEAGVSETAGIGRRSDGTADGGVPSPFGGGPRIAAVAGGAAANTGGIFFTPDQGVELADSAGRASAGAGSGRFSAEGSGFSTMSAHGSGQGRPSSAAPSNFFNPSNTSNPSGAANGARQETSGEVAAAEAAESARAADDKTQSTAGSPIWRLRGNPLTPQEQLYRSQWGWAAFSAEEQKLATQPNP